VEPVVDPDAPGAYPASWEADVVLRDGHTVHVRPIVADDAERLLRFHSRQSPESIYFRYFSPRPQLSDKDVRHFTHVDHVNRVAFVALLDDELVGVARYEMYRGTDTAEVAFFIDDAHHGRGLATLLLEFLAAAGQENGVRRFSASTLPTNRKMLGVFAAAGYDVASHFDDGVVEVAFDIVPTDASVAAMDRRERLAEAASVQRMLGPRSVAVVGAGRQQGLGADVFRNLLHHEFQGTLHPVNRDAEQVAGVAAVASVADLPDGVDLVVIATPADDVPGIVEECAARQVGAVVVLSAGFSEAGPEGAELERRVVDTTRRHGIRLLGPNCLGVLNTDPAVRLDATLNTVVPPAGRVGMLTEAGTLAAAIIDHAARIELGISTFVAGGNRADITSSDLLSYWVEDERTDAVLLSLATRDLLPRFVRAARATSLVKPVAALHTLLAQPGTRGPGPEGARRAQAMFRQTGVISVGTLEQLFDLGRILAEQPVPMGAGVAVVGNSDGAVMLGADACVAGGLELVDVTLARSSGGPVTNPIDLSHRATAADFAHALEVVAGDPRVDSVLVIYTPPRLELDADVVEVILAASAAHPEVTFVSTMLGAAGRGRLVPERGDGPAVPIFRFPEDAAHALGRLAGYRSWRRSADGAALEVPVGTDLAAARAVLADAVGAGAGGVVRLDPDQQQALLAAYQIEVAARRVVHTVDEAVAAADELGWPVVLKAARRDRSTRSAASGVVLDVPDEARLRASWDRLCESVGDGMVPAVVQRFIDSGVDVAVTVRRDPNGAGTIEVGLGGPTAILGDTQLGVLPLRLADATALVSSSAVGRALTDPLDRVPVVEVVHRLAALAEDLDTTLVLRADPVVASGRGAWVADVEVTVGDPVDDFSVRRLD